MVERLHPEHQDLLQFLYQFPVGVIAMDECGVVSTMNPAASQLLSPEAEAGESIAEPLTLLRRLAPELMNLVTTKSDQLGMISTGRGEVVDCKDGETRFSVTVHRLRPDHIIVSLTDVTEERRILNRQRARAQRLQQALLGSIDTTTHELSVAYLPAHREDLSGGDWYDVIKLDQDRVALVVGDVVGHDIEASATMGQLRSIVRAFARVDPDPISVLRSTDTIARSIKGADCATIHFAVLDPTTSSVTYASAGHPPPLLLHSNGTAELLTGGRRPVLTVAGSAEQQSASAPLYPGDVLIMYTDGLVERRGETLDVGFERLKQAALDASPAKSMHDLVATITNSMLPELSHPDDVCVLAIRFSE